MSSKVEVFMVKLENDKVTLTTENGVFYATSFCENRINEFYDEITSTLKEDITEITKQWNQSKLINFWPDIEVRI